MFWTYILLCENGAYYTGQTRHLARRCRDHKRGEGARYTRAFLPVRLAFYEAFATRSQALRCEAQLKALTHREKDQLVKQFPYSPTLKRINTLVFGPESVT